MAPIRRRMLVVTAIGLAVLTFLLVYITRIRTPSPQPPGASAPLFQPLDPPPTAEAPREGGRAPEFSAPRFGGGTLRLADLRGKGVVMNFFASWCTPCKIEAPALEAASRKYRSQGIVFIGVDIQQDTWDDALDFLDAFGVTYPAVRDETGEIARKYQLIGLPTTYFIDRDGIVRAKVVGAFLGPDGITDLDRRIRLILP
ncbi:MAG: TlpA disulfide reductase family protein [bacterium]